MKILLSAYACEPNKGSEPEVGWRWAITLCKKGNEVYVVTRKNNKINIEKYIKKNKINFVIHCASKVGGIQDNMNNQLKYLVENLNINKNIIMASYECGVKNFLNISSSCIYPKNIKKK